MPPYTPPLPRTLTATENSQAAFLLGYTDADWLALDLGSTTFSNTVSILQNQVRDRDKIIMVLIALLTGCLDSMAREAGWVAGTPSGPGGGPG